MANQLSERSDFTETLAIHAALKAALKAKLYDKNPSVRQAAEALCKDLQASGSIYERQRKLITLMERGATIHEFVRKLRCSRRTAFRYLNYLEDAGVDISLEGGKYRVSKAMARMARA